MILSCIELLIPTSVNAEELVGYLNQPGLMGAWAEAEEIHLYWSQEHWHPQVPHLVEEALVRLGASPGRIPITIRDVPWEDWNAKWAAQAQPVWIRDRILIRPSWKSVPLPAEGIEIILDPKQAFGTGHHATTQLMMEWLADCMSKGESVLDVGTDSGILAMLALRLGASQALGIDQDPIAIECAREYGSVNGFGKELDFQVATPDIQLFCLWDVILANLDRNTLLSCLPQLSLHRKEGTRLVLSGILEENKRELVEAAKAEGWVFNDIRKREQWLAMAFSTREAR